MVHTHIHTDKTFTHMKQYKNDKTNKIGMYEKIKSNWTFYKLKDIVSEIKNLGWEMVQWLFIMHT